MKNLIENNSFPLKQIFTKTNIILHRYLKSPLGEDFYTINTEDKEIDVKVNTDLKV